jgi:hypothetical protein
MEPYVWTLIRTMGNVGYVIFFLSFMYFIFQLVVSEFIPMRWKWIFLVAGDVEAGTTICWDHYLCIVCKERIFLGFCIGRLFLVLSREHVNVVLFCMYDFFQLVVSKIRLLNRDYQFLVTTYIEDVIAIC